MKNLEKKIEELKENGEWVNITKKPLNTLIKQKVFSVSANKEDSEVGWREPEIVYTEGFEVIEPILMKEVEENKVAFKGKIRFKENLSILTILQDTFLEKQNVYLENPIEILKSKLKIINDGRMFIGINSVSDLEVDLNNISVSF